jgi:hypothetical protein
VSLILLSSLLSKVRQLRIMDDLQKILAQFINTKTGQCRTCGHVHSVHNIDDEVIKRRKNNSSSSQYLDRLF